jgi:hypothetical protein
MVAITPLFLLSPVSQENVRKRKRPIDRNRRIFFESVIAGTVNPFPLTLSLSPQGRGVKREGEV